MLWVTVTAVLWISLVVMVVGLCRAAAAGDAVQQRTRKAREPARFAPGTGGRMRPRSTHLS